MAIISTPGRKKSEATLDAAAEATDWLLAQPEQLVSISIKGAAIDGTIEIQRSFDDGSTELVIEQFIVNGAIDEQRDIRAAAATLYRVEMTARNSGSAAVGVYTS